MAGIRKRPPLSLRIVSESEFLIIAELDKLIPDKSSSETNIKTAKNGTVTVHFSKQGLNLMAEVKEDKNKMQLYKLTVRRLPSQIEPSLCAWKLVKDEAHITLILKKQVSEDGGEFYPDWRPIVMQGGVEQYDSSEDEEGNTPDSVPCKTYADTLDKLGLDVERGKEQTIFVDAADIDKLTLG